eukprot:SAG22_NODE_5950_length_926_cov_2.101572_2_plen_21_part_01
MLTPDVVLTHAPASSRIYHVR